MKTFWILWHPQGTTPPTVMFAERVKAEKTAEAMINRIGSGTMFIMEAVGGVELQRRLVWQHVKGSKREVPKKADNS
jgi:hypothetical protein